MNSAPSCAGTISNLTSGICGNEPISAALSGLEGVGLDPSRGWHPWLSTAAPPGLDPSRGWHPWDAATSRSPAPEGRQSRRLCTDWNVHVTGQRQTDSGDLQKGTLLLLPIGRLSVVGCGIGFRVA